VLPVMLVRSQARISEAQFAELIDACRDLARVDGTV
jgi:hypothetical protein